MPGQTVQSQIRLLLEEQSDQGLHCLPFLLHRLDLYSMVEPHSSNFRVITTIFFGVSEYLGNLGYVFVFQVMLFFFTRCILGFVCALCEVFFYK